MIRAIAEYTAAMVLVALVVLPAALLLGNVICCEPRLMP